MHPFNRREFFQHSAAIAATLAALKSDNPLRAAPAAAVEKTFSASDKLRVAIIGVNGRGMAHVEGFNKANGCEIVTICDCDEAVVGKAMKAIEAKGGKARYEQDLRKVMDDKEVDIVSIATPNHWHALAAIWAMQAGKHVYVEKPVSHNVHEGRIMVETARKYKRICQTGTQARSAKWMQDAVAYIREGKIGKVDLAFATCYKRRNSIGKVAGEQKVPKSINYDLWCGPAPNGPLLRSKLHYDWHWFWDYGNGDLGNQGIHEMDKARWGLGVNQMPKSVMSLGGRFGYVDDGQTANTQLVLFDYGNAELIFEVRGLPSDNPNPAKIDDAKHGSNFMGNIFYGDKGTVVCCNSGRAAGVALDKDLAVIHKFNGGGEGHFGNFVKAVRANNRELLNADIAEGHLSSALCHLGNISYRLGIEKPMGEAGKVADSKQAQAAFERMLQHLKENGVDLSRAVGRVGPLLPIDAASERFSGGNDKANDLLFREYRKGFEVKETA